jgi:Lipase (class 3)
MNGYELDKSLSNHNQQVYYKPNEKKLLMSVAATHNLRDVGTVFMLGVGKLKNTSRYKEAKSTIDKVENKYNPMKTVVAGHSLGSSIANYIGSKDDQIIGLNGGYTIGQKTRANKTNYRTGGDLVSVLGASQKHVKTINNSISFLSSPWSSHNIDAIKSSKINI